MYKNLAIAGASVSHGHISSLVFSEWPFYAGFTVFAYDISFQVHLETHDNFFRQKI